MYVIVTILIAQTFLWPWHQYSRHRHYPHHVQSTCDKINAVAKSLPADRYEHALQMATEEERKIILGCAGARP